MSNKKRWQKLAGIITEQVEVGDKAIDLLKRVVKLAHKYDLTASEDGGSACEELIGEIQQFLETR